MRILYIGDIMASPGIEAVRRLLPGLRQESQIDVAIAQSENVTDGKSMSLKDMKLLQQIGVDIFTGGNHTPKLAELHPLLVDENQPVIGPANMKDIPGKGWKLIDTRSGKILVISLLGQTVGPVPPQIDNPLLKIEMILKEVESTQRVATLVNFHGDFSSEKVVIGQYLDGRVTAVIGDHWHIPTADARILPKGTAHITDVGMCGTLNSSLGVKTEIIAERWRDKIVNKNEIETEGPLQFNAVLIDTDETTGLAVDIQQVRHII